MRRGTEPAGQRQLRVHAENRARDACAARLSRSDGRPRLCDRLDGAVGVRAHGCARSRGSAASQAQGPAARAALRRAARPRRREHRGGAVRRRDGAGAPARAARARAAHTTAHLEHDWAPRRLRASVLPRRRLAVPAATQQAPRVMAAATLPDNVVLLSPLPLHTQIREALRARILDGTYREHAQLPSESELMASYGVSRITVRHALAQLQREGLIFKISGKGTFVSKP